MLDQISESDTQMENGDQASFNRKDIVDPAHYIGTTLLICTAILAVIGIPINMLVIGAIIFRKRLRFPRNIAWIGMGVANIFVLFSRLMLLISIHLETSTVSNRGFYSWFVFNSSIFLVLNIVLTVIERHICITYPQWHKRCISINFLIVFKFGMLALVFLTSMVIANLQAFQPYLSSFFDSWNFKLVGSIFAIIVPLFLTGFISFLAMFKKQTRQGDTPPAVPYSIALKSVNAFKPYIPAADLFNDKNSKTADKKDNKIKIRTSHFVHIGNNRISQIDLEARETFHCIAYIFLLFMAPIIMVFVSALISLHIAPSYSFNFIGAFYHIGVIMSCLHSGVANPVAFVTFSRDLFSCFKSRTYRNRSGFKQELQEDKMIHHPNYLATIDEKPDEESAM